MSSLAYVLKQDLFSHRYLALNAWHLKCSMQHLQKTRYSYLRHKFIKLLERRGNLYFRSRLLGGKVDIPYIEIVLTTRCSLKCQACNNMMQYFSPSNQYSTTYEDIKDSMLRLLESISSIGHVRIIGGEPLLFKELDKVILFLLEQEKIKHVNLVTNGTLPFKGPVLKALQHHKASVTISDYSANAELKRRLCHDKIFKTLEEYNIIYTFLFSKPDEKWRDPGRVYKRNRSNDLTIRNFRSCLMPCVSLISPNSTIREKHPDYNGALFLCPIASSLSQLKGLEEFEGDFVRLDSKNLKNDILEFYAKDFFKVCDYCHNKWEGTDIIEPALQTKKTYSLSPA